MTAGGDLVREWPAPNERGVFTPSERLECANPSKRWRSLPLAEINLIELADGWRSVTASCLPNGAGHSSPLTLRDRAFPDRDAAIAAARDRLRYRMEREDSPHAKMVLRWLDSLLPVQQELFA